MIRVGPCLEKGDATIIGHDTRLVMGSQLSCRVVFTKRPGDGTLYTSTVDRLPLNFDKFDFCKKLMNRIWMKVGLGWVLVGSC